MPTFAEFCAGIGGFRLGLEELGWDCVYSSEIDEQCERTYELNFGSSFDNHDLLQLNPYDLPDFDVLCAGFPCQPFSIAGKRQGFEDPRGNIFPKLMDIVQVANPSVIFLENVPFLVKHNGGQTFQLMTEQMENLGYTVFFEVLDSSLFGVPQKRPRVYIVAFRNDIETTDFSIIQSRTGVTGFRNFIEHADYSIPITDKWQEYIDLYTGRKTLEEMTFDVPKTRKQLERIGPNVELEDCIFQIRSSGIRAISIDEPLPTFAVSNSGGGAMIPVYSGERRHINLTEMKRIMGFPDHFQFKVARTHAVKQLANAVCPPVITSIGQDIENVLNNQVQQVQLTLSI
ncbi:DNA (cytosine-5-)-methyltransferase [Priestia megaterium]|uniref:Cytosine-specific methyltransferase n=1 Tax=Priestia megaterium TaxID=1404 RepID=A0A6H1P2E6_PRIMG|nr:DNA (cytosine-5-)-methyltransferase [Priestia megaterium]QIZ07622.1 DNA (cytosine-5-)-methyltransferase [Priestia megaterium]